MKINVSERLGSIEITPYKYNSLHFQNQKSAELFRATFRKYMKIKQLVIDAELDIRDMSNKLVSPGDVFLLDIGEDADFSQKNIQKVVQDQLIREIEKEERLFNKFTEIEKYYREVSQEIEMIVQLPDYLLDLNSGPMKLDDLLKVIPIQFLYKGDMWEDNNYIKKKNLIELILREKGNNILICLFYPETGLVSSEKKEFLEYLCSLDATILSITNDVRFLHGEGISENMTIYDKINEKIPLVEIMSEQELFVSNCEKLLWKNIALILEDEVVLNPYESRGFKQFIIEKTP